MQRDPGLPSSSRGVAWLVGCGLLVAVLAAYHNSFQVPFIFDDDSSIRDNPSIRSFLTAWQPPNDAGRTVSGRPVVNVTLALNHAVSGLEVWSYHLFNVLIHAGAAWLLWDVVRRVLRLPGLASRWSAEAPWLAGAIALLWAVHPLQTESVTYIVQRAESLVALFYLATLACFLRAVEPGAGPAWRFATVGACVLGMGTKEVMVSAPLLVLLADRVLVGASWREIWQPRGRLHLALAATWLVLGALVVAAANRGGTAGLTGAVSPWHYLLTQAWAIGHYIRLAFWPSPLVFDYGTDVFTRVADVVVPAGLLTVVFVGSAWAAWRARPIGWLGLLFFAVLAPSSSVVPVVTQTAAEHRFYLPLAAVVTVFVLGGRKFIGRWVYLGVAALAVALGGATVARNRDYREELTIWQDTVAKRPQSVRAHGALGAIHLKQERLTEALASLQEAVRLAPESVEAHNNLGNVWMKLGQWNEAAGCFRAALARKPGEPFALSNLGNALLQLGQVDEAIAQFEASLRAKPELVEPRYNLANTLAQLGRFAEAAIHYEQLLRVKPEDVEARSNYGDVLMEIGRPEEAIAQLEDAIRRQPMHADLHNNLGTMLARTGRVADALRHFREALRLRPDFEGARRNAELAEQAAGSR